MKKTIILFCFLTLINSGCSFFTLDKTVIKIKGSETMFNLTKRLTAEYSKENPRIDFIVEAGGTGAGIKALVANEIIISTASRNLEPAEVKLLSDNFGSIGVSTSIAKDALYIYLNKSNPISNLSLFQVKEIFSGNITNWEKVGWKSKAINVYLRNTSSGTLQLFKRLVLEDHEFASSSKSFNSITELHKSAELEEGSITFSGFVRNTKCKIISIDNIEPTKDNVISGYYPLTRYLFFHTLNLPEGEVKKFIDWTLGAKGQQIIAEEGFYSLFNYSLD
ncbi:MAG: PstS family phosphate ABC transporter substrate-binding protein [Melioribacteraceae bacterium]